MRQRLRRGLIWLIFAMSGATLFETTTFPSFTTQDGAVGGCSRFVTNGLLTPVDFCQVLDCQSGFLGGAIQPCNSTSPSLSVLIDCPGVTVTTGGSSSTTTSTTGT